MSIGIEGKSADIDLKPVDIRVMSVDIRAMSVDIGAMSVDIRAMSVDIKTMSIDSAVFAFSLPQRGCDLEPRVAVSATLGRENDPLCYASELQVVETYRVRAQQAAALPQPAELARA